MAEQDDRFLSRWARLKEQEKTSGAEDQPPVEANEVTERQPELDDEAREKLIAELPDIDTLDESSDFTAFLQSGVPEALRRRALRKLWRLNPVFANLDGLNDYDEDFTDAATVVQGLKTLYQVGKGMVVPEDETVEADETEISETDPAEAEAAEPEADEEDPESEPETAVLGAPEPEEPDTQVSHPAEARDAPVAVEPARAAKRRWGQFDSES